MESKQYLRGIITVILCLTSINYTTTASYSASNNQQLSIKTQHTIQTFQKKRAHSIQVATEKGLHIRTTSSSGKVYEISSIEKNMPIYKISHNIESADIIHATDVWESSSSIFNLSGKNIKLSMWDDGIVLHSHQEFDNRIENKEEGVISNHATHVAGTINATGKKNKAKGIAYKSHVVVHEWNNVLSEMLEDTNNGIQIANHSWGYANGWDWDGNAWSWYGEEDQSEDYKFGFYSDESESWDNLIQAKPELILVKSAGNDRNDNGPSGGPHTHYGNTQVTHTCQHHADNQHNGYDTLDMLGTGKNIITVGAINAAGGSTDNPIIYMSNFSAWGPTDDGRIKPDIVTKGTSIYSTKATSTTAYGYESGTSSATPALSGGIALLLEYQETLHPGKRVTAATIKGLLIHTTDEVGSHPGPDYKFGWGVANIKQAAQLMLDNKVIGNSATIQEGTLVNNNTITLYITPLETGPLKATIAWTDPSGTPPSITIDPSTLMLTNDLDIQIISPDGTTYHPWVLDPTHPESPATTGNNVRDNIEQIVINNPIQGTYTLNITHKNQLLNQTAQPFSLITSAQTVTPIPQADTPNPLQLSDVLNGPNPFNPLTTPSMTLQYKTNKAAIVDIYIYSINGEQLKHITRENNPANIVQRVEWNGRNEIGQPVPNGVYVAYIIAKATGEVAKQKRKIAILQ